MKPCSHSKQAARPAVQISFTDSRFGNSRQNSQQGGLAGAIATDDAHDFSGLDFEADILQSPNRRMT